MEIQELTVAEEKQKVVRQILEGLPEWFGIAEAREEYIAQSAEAVAERFLRQQRSMRPKPGILFCR